MASKQVEIPDIGEVTLVKRRGNTNIRMSFVRDGSLRISLPYWLPYQAGIEFAKSRQTWIEKHKPDTLAVLQDQDRIGKAHRLKLETRNQKSEVRRVSVRVRDNQVIVTCPVDMPATHASVQKAAERGALKALKTEADQLLPQRLVQLAKQHNFSYKSVSTKRLASRWGSCSQHKDIVLNIYLMQLPWELIDYVIIHELVHTEHLNHSAQFWRRFEAALPGAKALRARLKPYRTVLTAA